MSPINPNFKVLECIKMAIKKVSIWDILLIILFGIIFIITFTLGCLALHKKLTDIRIGNYTFPDKPSAEEIKLLILKPIDNSTNFNPEPIPGGDPKYPDAMFKFPISGFKPYVLNNSLLQEWPKCNTCVRRVASYLWKDRCYYIPPKKYTFEECFQVCANFSQCYYFYAPQDVDDSIIRGNLKAHEDLWIGVFKKDLSLLWETTDKRSNYSVWDVHGSYCAYIIKSQPTPISYFNCQSLKHCLCSGVSTPPPVLQPHRRH